MGAPDGETKLAVQDAAITHWVRFASPSGRIGFGTLESGRVVEYRGSLFDGAERTQETWRVDRVGLLAPCEPGKIVALWNNFQALATKLEKAPPKHPLFLIKPSTCVAGPGAPIVRPAAYAGKIAYEGELGIVIGRTARNVSASEANECIFGYTCVNDVTASELLNENPDFPQWTRAKGYDTFGCIGPAIARGFDASAARVVVRLDGVERQNYPLADMIFSPVEIVRLLSRDMTLQAGDVIACGTSLGVGSIKDGSTVEVTIDGIGTLRNILAA